MAEHAFPLILAGNCNTAAIGALAGIGSMQPSIVWLDGHADFCTPETTKTGFLDGMGLAMATGRCWTQMTSELPGFQPVPDERTLLVGAHEIEAREREDLRCSAIVHVTVDAIRRESAGRALADPLSRVRVVTRATYLHVDLDVHEPTLARANPLAPSGGLTPDEVRAAVRVVATVLPVRVASLTAYDPDGDSDEAMLGVALRLVNDLVASIDERQLDG
jgi:arginase